MIHIVGFSQQAGKVKRLSFTGFVFLSCYPQIANGNFKYFLFRFQLTLGEFPPALLGNSWIKPLINYDGPRKSLLICHSITIHEYAKFQFLYGFIKQDAIQVSFKSTTCMPWFSVLLLSGSSWFIMSAEYFVLYFSRWKMAGLTFSLFLFFRTWFSGLQIPRPLVSYMYMYAAWCVTVSRRWVR